MQRLPLVRGFRQLIAVLIEGYTTLNQRPWVLAVPVGLDLFLWLGPRILPLRLAQLLASFWEARAPTMVDSLQIDPDLLAQGTAVLLEWGKQTNLTHLLAASLTPLLLPRLSAPALPGYTPPAWAPALGWILLPIPLALVALGLLFWTLFLVPIADLVRGSYEDSAPMLRRVAVIWGHVLQLLGAILIGGFLLLPLAGLLASTISLLSPLLGAAMIYLLMGTILWAAFYLYFTPSAILVSGVGPWRAIRYSWAVVRSNLWPSLGFLSLVSLVRLGTASLWQGVAGHPLGVLAGILGNAYIVGGLATGGLIFYRNRLRAWLADQRASASP